MAPSSNPQKIERDDKPQIWKIRRIASGLLPEVAKEAFRLASPAVRARKASLFVDYRDSLPAWERVADDYKDAEENQELVRKGKEKGTLSFDKNGNLIKKGLSTSTIAWAANAGEKFAQADASARLAVPYMNEVMQAVHRSDSSTFMGKALDADDKAFDLFKKLPGFFVREDEEKEKAEASYLNRLEARLASWDESTDALKAIFGDIRHLKPDWGSGEEHAAAQGMLQGLARKWDQAAGGALAIVRCFRAMGQVSIQCTHLNLKCSAPIARTQARRSSGLDGKS